MGTKGSEKTAALWLLQRLVFYWDVDIATEFQCSHLLGFSRKCRIWSAAEVGMMVSPQECLFGRLRKFTFLLQAEILSFI